MLSRKHFEIFRNPLILKSECVMLPKYPQISERMRLYTWRYQFYVHSIPLSTTNYIIPLADPLLTLITIQIWESWGAERSILLISKGLIAVSSHIIIWDSILI